MKKSRLRSLKGLDDSQIAMLLTMVKYPDLYQQELETIKNHFPRSYKKWLARLGNEGMRRNFHRLKQG